MKKKEEKKKKRQKRQEGSGGKYYTCPYCKFPKRPVDEWYCPACFGV